MDLKRIRSNSITIAKELGYQTNELLPLLNHPSGLKSEEAVVRRLCCLNACVAVAFEFKQEKAYDWISKECLLEHLTPGERDFIEQGQGNVEEMKMALEGMWALAWSLSLVPQLDFGKYCGDDFVSILPDLRIAKSLARMRKRSDLRALDEIVEACDLSYCLHWALAQMQTSASVVSMDVRPYVAECPSICP